MKRIYSLLLMICCVFLLTGCDKKPLSANDFVDLTEQKGYVSTNVIEDYTDYPQIKNIFIIQNKEMTYQIEYYELDSIDSSKLFYNTNVKIFKEKKNIKKNNSIKKNNYQKYTQSTDTIYSLISRIDNTIVYSEVNIKYKDEIDKLIKTIGY